MYSATHARGNGRAYVSTTTTREDAELVHWPAISHTHVYKYTYKETCIQ